MKTINPWPLSCTKAGTKNQSNVMKSVHLFFCRTLGFSSNIKFDKSRHFIQYLIRLLDYNKENFLREEKVQYWANGRFLEAYGSRNWITILVGKLTIKILNSSNN